MLSIDPMYFGGRRIGGPLLALVAALLCGALSAVVTSQERPVTLQGVGSTQYGFSIQPLPDSADNERVLVLVSSAPDCHFPPLFEVPTQLNETAFLLKRMVRLSGRVESGRCVETLVSSYTPPEFHYLATATSVVLHLPAGALMLSAEVLDLVRAGRPREAAPYPRQDLGDVPNRLIVMAANGQAAEARKAAEEIAPLVVSRPPAEALPFFAALGMARRAGGDLPAATTAYEVASLIAVAAKDSTEFAGVVFDNLATVRRLQRQFRGATEASDRALALLSAVAPGGRSHGGALNNRAMLLSDSMQFAEALDYSERALTILRNVFRAEPNALAPFLEDNRRIRERIAGR